MVHGQDESPVYSGPTDYVDETSSGPSPLQLSTPGSPDQISEATVSTGPQTPAEKQLMAKQRSPCIRPKRPQRDILLSQLIEEQRKLRIALENSKQKEFELGERALKMQEEAAEREKKAADREERMISLLEKCFHK
ncbi:uncharacterized protein LOC144119010 [Amblyomma americanum]